MPETFSGRVLLQSLPSWSVVAELEKVPGPPIVLALPAGSYAAILRRGPYPERCLLTLRDGFETVLETRQCLPFQPPPSELKGRLPIDAAVSGEEGWLLEAGLGLGLESPRDDYSKRLNQFEFERDAGNPNLRFAVNIGRRLHPNFAVGLTWFNLAAPRYVRELTGQQQGFRWNAHALAAFAEGSLSLAGAGSSACSRAPLPERAWPGPASMPSNRAAPGRIKVAF